jgi:hypothetical protein
MRPIQATMRQSLVVEKEAFTDNPVIRIQENEIEEWIETNKGVEITEAITDEQIIDSVIDKKRQSCLRFR